MTDLRRIVTHFEQRLCDIQTRQEWIINALGALLRAQGVELTMEQAELAALDRIEHPPVDALGLRLDGVVDKPAPQVLGAKGVEAGRVMEPAAMPPDLERRLAVVGDEAFQRFCQTACDHGIDPGEHPVKQAARVILSICCVSTPYALAEPEPAARLDALLARFHEWEELHG